MVNSFPLRPESVLYMYILIDFGFFFAHPFRR